MLSVLGISAFYHDAAAALVVDGDIAAAAAEERFTRLKHDFNFPQHAIRFCLEQAAMSADQLDAVVFYESPHLKFTRVVATTLAGFPSSRRFFVSSMKEWLKQKLWLQNQISSELGIHPRKIKFVDHHTSHLAQAFLSSPFSEAAVLSMDAVGEWTCTSIGHGTTSDKRTVIPIELVPYPHSLGLVYAAFTAFLGFRPNDQEASTMALAAFGKPRYVDEIRQIIKVNPGHTYSIDHTVFNLLSTGKDLFTSRFIEIFGAPRDHRQTLPFDALDDDFWRNELSSDHQRFADIAASLQRVLETTILELANRASRLTGSKNLCVAGGVALNAVANTALIEHSPFTDVFIPPDPGDGGAALGAALLEYYRNSNDLRPLRISPWLGKAYSENIAEGIVQSLNEDAWSENQANVSHGQSSTIPQSERGQSIEQIVERVADDLDVGYVVGWFQERFEFGPRALGNRSILADPANLETVERLSKRVKKRASFRPCALVICEEDIEQVFDFQGPIPRCARWMQMVKAVRPGVISRVRGAVHIDGTTRLQICSARDNPNLHRVLIGFKKRRGLGALLNTSFNEAGYPMLASPTEALLMFARTQMDTLVINRMIIRRQAHVIEFPIGSGTQLDLGILQHREANA